MSRCASKPTGELTTQIQSLETVINDPKDLRCNRLLLNLPELQARARAINHRLLETETECTAIPGLACSGPPPSC